MYVPSHFNESRADILHDLIEKNPLGILFTNGTSGLDANHIPFELDRSQGRHGVLHSHVARANPVWQDIADGAEVLVVFRAADAYISPNWYPSTHDFHKQVPTWNYMVAHAYGHVTIRDDERYVRGMVAKLTRRHEASEAKPWRMTDSSKEFISSMLTSIVGMEIEVTRLVGKSKLSQNKEVRDIRTAGETLRQKGEKVIANAMLSVADEKDA
jgi:transcriptional regulator